MTKGIRDDTAVCYRGCREGCHDNSVAELTVPMSVEATYYDAVRRVCTQPMQHGLASLRANHTLTVRIVVVYIRVCIIIATIQHHEPFHAYPLLGHILCQHATRH